MPVALSLTDTIKGNGVALMLIAVALTGSYPAADVGETIDLTSLTDPNGLDLEGFFENPTYGGIFAQAAAGNQFTLVPGTLLTNWKLHLWTASNTEAGNVTYASLGIASPQNILILQIPRRIM